MRTIYSYLLFFTVIALSSCSSSYRTGGTPDDVYYSPGQHAVNSSSNSGEYYNANANDQYLMMRAQDPNRWSYFDDYDYGYSSAAYSPYAGYGYGMYSGYGYGYSPWMTFGYWNPYYSFFSSYYMWNSFYNPYYGGVIVVNTKYPIYNTYNSLHPFALTSYTNTSINNRNNAISHFYTPAGSTIRNNGGNYTRISQRNSYYNQNNLNRTNNNNNFRQSNFQQSTRSYTPSSFGGGGGGRSFSRPGKG